ncbi:MAG: carboxypeptidase-like regulatory domain-containing protein, partial [Bryobacteraceae bacterium]
MKYFEMALSAVCVVCFAASLKAQVNATGTFSGQVTDPAGNAVVNARIRLIDQQAGAANTKFTSSDGNYVF